MNNTGKIENLLKARGRETVAAVPPVNIPALKADLLKYLGDLKLPAGCSAASWDELIQEFPIPSDDQTRKSGLRMRLALRLYTKANTYLLSIMECLDPDSVGVFLISVHVNWTLPEKQHQKIVEESYRGQFDDVLRAKHTLWAQSFRPRELPDALVSCFRSVLSHELIAGPARVLTETNVTHQQPTIAHFPKPDPE